jgi:hypothetical protein
MSIPALLKWLDLLRRDLTLAFGGSRFGRGLRRPDEPDGSRVVATDSALEAEQKRLADLKAELAAAETQTAERERQISVKLRKLTAAQRERTEAAGELAKQEAALAQRLRILERSLADAERSAAEATARIEAREAVLATQEAELQQQESEVADRHRSVAERERELIRAREEDLGAAESDWWAKQLGRPLSARHADRTAPGRRKAREAGSLEREVGAFVDERLNGHTVPAAETGVGGPENDQEATNTLDPKPGPPPPSTGATTKTCRVCGETKPADKFEPRRRVCRTCRARQVRDRQTRRQAPDDDEPHQAASPQTGRRSRRTREGDDHWALRRRALIEEARANGVTHEELGGRVFIVLHLAPQSPLPPLLP